MKYFFLLFFFVVSFYATAQRLKMYKTFGGVVFELDDSVQLSMKQTMMLLNTNQPAYEEMKKARGTSTVSALMGFSGAALVAVPIVTAAVGQTPEWGLAAGGGALMIGAFLVNQRFKARALYAIDLYNEHAPQKTSRIKPELFFYGTGAQLVIKF